MIRKEKNIPYDCSRQTAITASSNAHHPGREYPSYHPSQHPSQHRGRGAPEPPQGMHSTNDFRYFWQAASAAGGPPRKSEKPVYEAAESGEAYIDVESDIAAEKPIMKVQQHISSGGPPNAIVARCAVNIY